MKLVPIDIIQYTVYCYQFHNIALQVILIVLFVIVLIILYQ